eukprot:CAMPEP_0113498982 /NCGR_PEP_ID=MMETSP0014_2-20120614/31492_1 /TAXON_ID=2857 /ORGANISM="Nitzschia sp." /LENGTH=460 /DNA_ID=CAMNT_0000393101 /DNA_START=115 /DNA_END=1497 /DNA_ORIENTATION=+ /assembly_acc=CAM_ASM_000159
MTAPPAADKQRLKDAGAKYAKTNVEKSFADSNIQDKSGEFPKFTKSELSLGKVLGKGGFGTVYEVRAFDASKTNSSNTDKKLSEGASRTALQKAASTRGSFMGRIDDEEVEQNQMESRKFIAGHCLRKSGEARYAAKFLSLEVINDPASFIQGVTDMAVETRVLSDTDHPNIVRMRAIAEAAPYDESYYIVMDRLFDILETRIEKWDKLSKKCSGMKGKIFDRKGEKLKDLNTDRMVAAFDLSSAVEYLHGRKIVYRDIKPENIGFDIRDDIKLFDFGLATELKDSKKASKEGLYKLTEMTGSPIYMAPEVANGEDYNEKCDSYSFAILLWQMMEMDAPYKLYTMRSLRTKVWNGPAKRPMVGETWPVPIKTLLRRSWSKEIGERPSFSQISKILRAECVRIRDGNEDGLEHSRRRSTFVFRGARGQLTSTKTAKQRPSAAAAAAASMPAMLEEIDEEEE